jgi:hypothetical protein
MNSRTVRRVGGRVPSDFRLTPGAGGKRREVGAENGRREREQSADDEKVAGQTGGLNVERPRLRPGPFVQTFFGRPAQTYLTWNCVV